MHSTACGVGATSTNTSAPSMQSSDGLKMVHNNEDAMNKIPLKSSNGLDDEEKNGGELLGDTTAAEEARREQMRANILVWMKKLTIVLICFIGLALISYVIISLCFSEWPKQTKGTTSTTPATPTAPNATNNSLLPDNSTNNSNNNNDSSHRNETPAIAAISTHTKDATIDANQDSSGGINQGNIASSGKDDDVRPITDKTIYGNDDKDVAASTVALKMAEGTMVAPITPISTVATEAKKSLKTVAKDVPITTEKFTSTLDVYHQAAVCSDKQLCSQIGSKILEDEGSAVDSAIATLLCNGMTTSQSMGLGGGMLMNIYLKTLKHGYSIDAREVAPFGSSQDMFNDNLNASLHGGLSIAVPGELMGYYRAHKEFGKLPWRKLVEPSLQLCEEGFYLTKHQHYSIKFRWNLIRTNDIFKEMFVNSTTGELYPVGTKLKPSKALCETYKMLADNGPMDFYKGNLSKLVAEDLKDLGSLITADDLESYKADLISSITMQLGDDILYSVPPVSSGTVVSHVLSILEGFNFTKNDWVKNETLTIHRFVEALKIAFAKRGELGDLRFIDARELISKITNPEYSAAMRLKINDSTVLNDIYDYGAQYVGEDNFGTSHVVTMAPNGDAVSVTSSVNNYFGSGLVGKRTGIVFNSGMSDFSVPGKSNMFSLPPSPSNFIEERKRAMSSMSPMILATQQGDIKMVIGAAGGSKIISGIAEVMARVLWANQNIKEAIDAPRFHHQLLPNVLEYEHGQFSEEVLKQLKAKGHELKAFKNPGSVVCGLVRNATAIYVNADFRKQGGTAGF